jgi:hypothetical protein
VQSWQGTLTAGQSHEVAVPDGTTAIELRTGNATATSAKLNDKKIDIDASGITSVVRTATITVAGANGAAASSSSATGTADTDTDTSASSESSAE